MSIRSTRAPAPAPVGAHPARRTRLDNVLTSGLLARPRRGMGAATGEFYKLPPDEAGKVDPITLEPMRAGAGRGADDATFRLPFHESAAKNDDGSYKFRVYDAAALWKWVSVYGQAFDPIDKTLLLQSDWEKLRDRYSSKASHPTPHLPFRPPILGLLWPPRPWWLTNATIRDAVMLALTEGGPEYIHPDYGPISGWDVSAVTNMNSMFRGAVEFNGDLSGWDVSAVTQMRHMFHSASAFDGDLSLWDVRNVTSMYGMFHNANVFTGDLSNWKAIKVIDIDDMFDEETTRTRSRLLNPSRNGVDWSVRHAIPNRMADFADLVEALLISDRSTETELD